MKLIGISGKMGVGKNYLADILVKYNLNNYKVLQMAFADQLKVDCIVRDGVEYDKVFGDKDKNSRMMLQRRGTEEGRDKYGKDIWVNYMRNWIRIYGERGIDAVIITDVRFKNEAVLVKEMGGVLINIVSPKRNIIRVEKECLKFGGSIQDTMSHRSETDLDDFNEFDYVFNNDEMGIMDFIATLHI